MKDGENKNTHINAAAGPDSDAGKESIEKYRKKKKYNLTAEEYVEGILSGNRTILGKAITIIESSLPAHSEIAFDIISRCVKYAGNSIRIGITGVPGVGKSSFIEALGTDLVSKDHKLAVLAVDPSSEITGGSILGDKTRMEQLSAMDNVFIRPSPSAGSPGGVARKTREAIILCEAAGYDTIFVETVGVGQSETAVHSMVDFFLLLMLAGAGDELQGIKRGIMEIADAVAITKCDGSNLKNAERARKEYENALHMFPPKESGWSPRVLTCSARTNHGIGEVWDTISEYRVMSSGNGWFVKKRSEQARFWMYETINMSLENSFYKDRRIQKLLGAYEKKVIKGEMAPTAPAKPLLEKYFTRYWIRYRYTR
jgi:LAO/AO transport system kinase